MAQMQNMLDFPPAPKLTRTGARSEEGRRERAARREAVLRQGAVRVVPPGAVLPRQPDARPAPGAVPQDEPGDGPIKSFTLRGIKDSPPYLHDGRCLTLEDTVEFFNLVLGVKLTKNEKSDLVAFLRQL
jgi:cytochrome c peroxidase